MLDKYIPKRFAPALIKHVVAVSLFFPYIYSSRDNFYYPDFILANFFAILAMISIFTSWELDLRKNGILLTGMGILLIAYNVSFTYMNYHYHHWYGEQINTTICFLFFMVLLMVKDVHTLIDDNVIRSIIHMMVTTNVLAIGYRLITDQNRILIMNNYVRLDKYDPLHSYQRFMIDQYSWVYFHKSQYALILVICIAFCVIFRKRFRNLITYLLTLGILGAALYLSDSYTSLAAASLIIFGQFIDYLCKAKWWKKLVAAFIITIPGVFACVKIYEIIGNNRDLLTLGERTLIWNGSWETITKNPYGVIDYEMGVDIFGYAYHAEGWKMRTYNCHNVFLNQMFRFSILVGCLFALLLLVILLFMIIRHFTFTTLSIVIAFIIPLCMDYSLTNVEFILLLTLFFIMFFKDSQKHEKNRPNN